MTEWPIVPDSKSGVRATVPGVQIPLSPRFEFHTNPCEIFFAHSPPPRSTNSSVGSIHFTRFAFSFRILHARPNNEEKNGSTPKRVDFNERRRIEPRPSICNFQSFYNRKPFVVSVSFSYGSLRLFRYFSYISTFGLSA